MTPPWHLRPVNSIAAISPRHVVVSRHRPRRRKLELALLALSILEVLERSATFWSVIGSTALFFSGLMVLSTVDFWSELSHLILVSQQAARSIFFRIHSLMDGLLFCIASSLVLASHVVSGAWHACSFAYVSVVAEQPLAMRRCSTTCTSSRTLCFLLETASWSWSALRNTACFCIGSIMQILGAVGCRARRQLGRTTQKAATDWWRWTCLSAGSWHQGDRRGREQKPRDSPFAAASACRAGQPPLTNSRRQQALGRWSRGAHAWSCAKGSGAEISGVRLEHAWRMPQGAAVEEGSKPAVATLCHQAQNASEFHNPFQKGEETRTLATEQKTCSKRRLEAEEATAVEVTATKAPPSKRRRLSEDMPRKAVEKLLRFPLKWLRSSMLVF
mmetsp:Transcript_17111/g.39911  ORF Transcript_17111/g.39911 Transcript_17111/m.39911 type:complete len:388 (-) Transcript_17111:221-1384(-)